MGSNENKNEELRYKNDNDNEKLLALSINILTTENTKVHGIIYSFPLYYTLREIKKMVHQLNSMIGHFVR